MRTVDRAHGVSFANIAAWGDGRVLAALAVFCICYFLLPNDRLDFSTFDQFDAAAYLALSEALVQGYGYTRSLDPLYFVPHATWPPGMAILLAPFTFLAGMPINLLIVKIGMISYGVTGILLAYVYAMRLSADPRTWFCVPLLLGLNPYYWQFSRMTDSEMPTIVWSLVALLVTDVVWSKRAVGVRGAFVSGLVCGLGMLIRGSMFGGILLPLVHIAVRGPRAYGRNIATRYFWSTVGFCLPFGAWMARNTFIDSNKIGSEGTNQVAMVFRTNPLLPASPFRSVPEILEGMVQIAKWQGIYELPKGLIPGLWSPSVWDALGHIGPPVAIVLSAAIVVLSLGSIRNLPAVTLYATMAVLNLFYTFGGMDRLWVPVVCLVAITVPIGIESFALVRGRAANVITCTLLLMMAASTTAYAIQFDRRPYRDAAYAALASLYAEIRAHRDYDGNFLTPRQDAFALYTGLPAPLSVPGIGVDPRYRFIILPSADWNPGRLPGDVLLRNELWSLVQLREPLRLAEITARYPGWQR